MVQTPLRGHNIINGIVYHHLSRSCQAWSKATDSRSVLVGVHRFESGLRHFPFYSQHSFLGFLFGVVRIHQDLARSDHGIHVPSTAVILLRGLGGSATSSKRPMPPPSSPSCKAWRPMAGSSIPTTSLKAPISLPPTPRTAPAFTATTFPPSRPPMSFPPPTRIWKPVRSIISTKPSVIPC